MPVVSVKAKARIPAVFMATIPVQRRLRDGAWWKAKQAIAIAVKYPMKSTAIAVSPALLRRRFPLILQEQEKSCALCHNGDWGRSGIIPGPLVRLNV